MTKKQAHKIAVEKRKPLKQKKAKKINNYLNDVLTEIKKDKLIEEFKQIDFTGRYSKKTYFKRLALDRKSQYKQALITLLARKYKTTTTIAKVAIDM